ncbi:hypothetical protein ITP31_003916 [Salmonella enterica]|uniref:hypothetical protein n=1 Tax=Serratia phage PCH45 TaxID=2608368 RepID=UPI0012A7F931|nr:hypothetical protein [Salmonella enterica]QFP93161.1 hypothetical protein [Serratia phage PCH45]
MAIAPPLDTKGRFVLKAPFKAEPTKLYTVIGLRKFMELVSSSVNIFADYYAPLGLTQTNYEDDYKAKATLVILYSEDGEMLFVPSTYIQSFPSQSIPAYANYVISGQLGPFRTDYDFSFVKQKVAEVLSDVLGVEPEIFVDSIGEAQAMSVENAENLEANRQAAIKDRTTAYAQLLAKDKIIGELQEEIKSLQTAYIELSKGT